MIERKNYEHWLIFAKVIIKIKVALIQQRQQSTASDCQHNIAVIKQINALHIGTRINAKTVIYTKK